MNGLSIDQELSTADASSPRMPRATAGVATTRLYSAQRSATRVTSSALDAASRLLSQRTLSSRPVRQWPPISRHQRFTSSWCRPMPAATQVASGINVFSLRDLELEDVAIGRLRVFHPEHELHVQRRLQHASACVVDCVVQHRQIEHLDLRLHAVRRHLLGQLPDEVGRVLVHPSRKVHRPGRERRHVRSMVQHAAALGAHTRAAAGRELDDDARAQRADAFLELGELVGVGGRGLIVVSDVHVHERSAGLERRLRGLDLLGDGDRNGRVVLFARHRAGDGDGDDAGLWHGARYRDVYRNSCGANSLR